MLLTVTVFAEVHTAWPRRGDREAGERWALLVLDMTKPRKAALHDMYEYSMTPEEKARYWGKLEGRAVVLGVTQIANGKMAPYMRGEIIEVLDGEAEK